MKFGPRKPNFKKSIKARTTGKMKRKVKSSVIPGYGKKGSGWMKNPKKAAYNKVYNKTSFSTKPTTKKRINQTRENSVRSRPKKSQQKVSVNKFIFFVLALTLGFFGAQWFYSKNFQKGIMYLLFSWTFIPFFISLYQAFKALFTLTDSSYKIFV